MEDLQKLFMNQTTEETAEYLLGMYLEHTTSFGKMAGYIVDCEAYVGVEDEAAHSFGGRQTPRLKAMYMEAGTIYLYTMHTHLILNIVTKEEGNPQGVMIRGLEPVEGLSFMEVARGGIKGKDLSNGPGKLVKAMGIDKNLYGQSIFSSDLHIIPDKKRTPKQIEKIARIGIPNKGKWTEEPLRYIVKGNPYVTGIKKADIDENNGWKD